MPDIPMDLLGLFALIAGGAAWVVAGIVNKWLGPRLDPADPVGAGRTKAFVSLLVMVLCAFLGFLALNAIRNVAGDEKGFFAMLVASFAAQKAFFMATDSLLALNKTTPAASETDAQQHDKVDRTIVAIGTPLDENGEPKNGR